MTPNMIKNFSLTIPPNLANQRLDQALAQLCPEYSRTLLQTWIKNGNILINQHPAKAKEKIKGGEQVTIQVELPPISNWLAENIPLKIVYEDNDVLVVYKPIGLIVHPGAGNNSHTLLNALLYHAPNLQYLPRAGILHRLDKNTSGLLLVAKTMEALKNLSLQLKKRMLLREYQALVHGIMISGGLVNAPIGRHSLQRQRMAVTESGKEAITHYRVLEKFRHHTLLKLRLETGRTHQIRVHMAYIHHPIVGDPTYGRLQLSKGMHVELIEALRHFKHQALHAATLGFIHPVTHNYLEFNTELPADMQQLITLLKKDKESNL
jgi:23S rRNA pseudouridine1911/1915/1917 synthase